MAEPETPDAGTRLRVARARYEKAIAEMRRAESVYSDPSGQHPDGTAALRNANRQLEIASEEFALRYTIFRMRCWVTAANYAGRAPID